MATLEVIKGENAGQIYQLTENESVVGRYPFCEVVIPSHTVSRQHARISFEDGKYFIEDLGSLNGTFINGKRIKARAQLKHEDRIRIYDMLLLFHEKTVDKPSYGQAPQSPEPQHLDIDETPDKQDPEASAIINALEVRPTAANSDAGRKRMRAAMAVSQQLSSLTSIDDILTATLEHAFQLFPQSDRGHVLIIDEHGQMFPKAVKYRDEAMGAMTLAPISRKMATQVVSKGEAFIATSGDVPDDEDSSASIFGSGISVMMCAPLIGPSRTPLGILHLDCSDPQQCFEKADLEQLVSLGLVAGQAAEIANLAVPDDE